ncbi:short chain dehydrogenase [Alteromonas aestuariivivens]|uniref:Short chain dehydrogenase n=1 Tax=Alteromonas aestuariivivens TaxID=1938339 RepID=A0A3D8MAB1_9ALTE|nr:SDR family oxidoreductase [Alteromonas aestuariivivens]RDV26760.1 short chain dehydrogenase [Alteromonas aestuariivivens]
MSMVWKNDIAVLTGATGGIGQTIARVLAQKGVTLLLNGRNAEKLEALRQALPGEHITVAADINTETGRNALVETCAEMPYISLLINNAGTSITGAFTQLSEDQQSALVQTNLLAPMALTQRLMPMLSQARQAHVVNVGSTFGSIGFPYHAAYCASKFGLRGWTEALQREHHGQSVSFHYLAPRATHTEINSSEVVAMNKALGNKMDPPELVATELVQQLEKKQPRCFIGFPEKLFARINGIFPGLVDSALRKQLPTVKHHIASSHQETQI